MRFNQSVNWITSVRVDHSVFSAEWKMIRDLSKYGEDLGFSQLSFFPFYMDGETREQLDIRIDGITASVRKNDVLFWQYPLYGLGDSFQRRFLAKMKARGVHIVVVVHDFQNLRFPWNLEWNREIHHDPEFEVFSAADAFIVPSMNMASKLLESGFSQKAFIMRISPYDSGYQISKKEDDCYQLTYAGNIQKANFLDSLANKVPVHFFGKYQADAPVANTICHGKYGSEAIISELNYGFGLVWDEDIELTSEKAKKYGNFYREYTRYNAPHKLSMYLRAGLPVILWSQQAQSDWVTELVLGFTVDELEEIPERLSNISVEEYQDYCTRVLNFSNIVADAYDFKIAALSASKYVISHPYL